MAALHVSGGGALYLSTQTSASLSTAEVELKSAAQKLGTKSKDGAELVREYVGGSSLSRLCSEGGGTV